MPWKDGAGLRLPRSSRTLVERFVNTYQVISTFSDDETAVIVWICRRRVSQPTYKGLTKRSTSKVAYSEAITYFARALGAARSGNAESARANVDKLQSLAATLRDAKQAYWAEQVEIQHRMAEAWLAHAAGKHEEALTLMRNAVEREEATEKHPVTPGPIMPARELLGDLLLELHDPAHALQEFETSIQKEPNRFNGLYGAARAAELAGEKDKARSYYDKVVALCERSDSARPELQQAKAFLVQP